MGVLQKHLQKWLTTRESYDFLTSMLTGQN